MTENTPQDYIPIVYEVPSLENDIMSYDPNPQYSTTVAYPEFSLGFQHFIHQSKDKMEKTKQFEGKKRVYLVVSEFERYVDDYNDSIGIVSKNYFNLNGKNNPPNILSRAFYKLWEILFMFDLIDLNQKDFVSAHLAEGPGSFIQATMFYRDMYATKNASKNDKYYAVTLHADKKHIQPLEQSFIDYYSKEKPPRFIMHPTYSGGASKINSRKDNGDITTRKTREMFRQNFKDQKADFITADGGFNWQNENIQEQESYKLILSQIIMALKIQNKGGSFVCKLYETFTQVGSKFISILRSFYDEMYLVKPLMSRASNSEKYAVCIGFKYNNSKEFDDLIEKLELIMDDSDNYLINIFPDYEDDEVLKATKIAVNTKISNKQFKDINEIVAFIDKQNYRGDEYLTRRQMQISASKYWIDKFLPNIKEFNKNKDNVEKFTTNLITSNNDEVMELSKDLI